MLYRISYLLILSLSSDRTQQLGVAVHPSYARHTKVVSVKIPTPHTYTTYIPMYIVDGEIVALSLMSNTMFPTVADSY